MVDVTCIIKENRQISSNFYLLIFEWNFKWGIPLPGMFCEVRVTKNTDPLLRRPLGFAGYDKNISTASIIYENRGPVTSLLALKKRGDTVKIIGPLGNPFNFAKPLNKIFATGGGIGLGPVLFTAQKASDLKIPFKLILGFRTRDLVPDLSFADHLSPLICTDDGSTGYNGNVVSYLESQPSENIKNSIIHSCGPLPMLKACHFFALKKNLKCQVSMEEMMACGVGACSGCVIKNAEGNFDRVCKEGPVFESRKIAWI
jgi:dihydroorotate dehydrogenase electron transfer subunit